MTLGNTELLTEQFEEIQPCHLWYIASLLAAGYLGTGLVLSVYFIWRDRPSREASADMQNEKGGE